jgi:geranylgeranyl diphosphate synthase type II
MANENSGISDGKNYNTFKELIEDYRPRIYQKICDYIPMKEPLDHYKIMRDYVDRQGKYARPGLLVLVGRMYGAASEDLILPAAAQQLSEDWILMQDDIEDDSELRRGKPAAQKLYGWVHSLNATNTGQIAMWKMLKDYIIQRGPEIGNQLYDKFYDMMEYTVEGQYVENHFIHDTKDISNASEELYMRIVDSKTCFYTIHGPMQLGAIAAGHGDPETLKMLKEIGTETGIAFQIVDDILDMTADEAKFGKQRLGDLYEGKVTLIVLHAYKNATQEEKTKMAEIYKKKRQDKTTDEIKFVEGLAIKYGSVDYARVIADQHGDKATALIEKYRATLPNNQYTNLYVDAVKSLYKRDK